MSAKSETEAEPEVLQLNAAAVCGLTTVCRVNNRRGLVSGAFSFSKVEVQN